MIKYLLMVFSIVLLGGLAIIFATRIRPPKTSEAGPAVKISKGSTVRVYGRLVAKHDDAPTTYVLTFNGTPADEELAPATAAKLEELFKAKP